ncbi:hypothetical protein [Nonomuraea sp. NPDC001023]|uniref:hypothetical protein n=1 Tax=unclassified Nonomuraea TaxID=2593643 RepID=UPI00332BD99D
MAESSPYRHDRTPEEQAPGSGAPARPSPEVCLEISGLRVEEAGPEGRRDGPRARATLRVRLDDVAHLIGHLLTAAPHLLDHLTPATAAPPPRTPRHAFPATPDSPAAESSFFEPATAAPRTPGTPGPGTPAAGTTASAARGGGVRGVPPEEGRGMRGSRPEEGGGVWRGWPRGGAPSWRPERKHAGDLGAATGRTIRHAAPGEQAPHTVPGHEVLDVETHAGTAARPMTEQAARHGDASPPTPPTRPYFAPDEGTVPDEPARQARDVMPPPADRRSRAAGPDVRDPGPGRSRTPHAGVGPRPGLDPPPQEPSHPGLAHRIPSQPGPRAQAPVQPAHAPQASAQQQQPGRPASHPGGTSQEWTRPHVPPQGTAQPRPGRSPAPPDTEPAGPARPEVADQPWPGRSTSPRPAGPYRPGLDPPPQSEQPHDRGDIPRPTRGDRTPRAASDRTSPAASRAAGGAGAAGVARNEGAAGNGVASERLGGVAAGWS